MTTRRIPIIAAVGLVAIATLGCDPGYEYTPVDAAGAKVPRWSTTIDGVRLSAEPYSTLIGSRSTFMELGVANESGVEVEVLAGEMETGGRTLWAGVPPGPENRAARIVPAGGTRTVSLLVDLGGAAADILGPSLTWVWRVRIGTAEHTLRVRMDR